MAKVTSVVHIATQRAVPLASGSLPRTSMMNSAPSSGRKVTTERIGQSARADHSSCMLHAANMNQVMKAAAPISMAKA